LIYKQQYLTANATRGTFSINELPYGCTQHVQFIQLSVIKAHRYQLAEAGRMDGGTY